jgi:hypothetical protein
MITASELRIGNYVLHKGGVRILPVKMNFEHFQLLQKGSEKDFFPIKLQPDVLLKCGFEENKSYALLPDERQFILTLPIIGNNKNEVIAFVHKEIYARAVVNDLVITNHFYYLHQLQNVYFALTGKELEVTL